MRIFFVFRHRDIAVRNVLVFAKNSYSAYITENNSPGISIFAVSARDADWNQNARISYILEDTDEHWKGLEIDVQ